jgi:hypothetical protein
MKTITKIIIAVFMLALYLVSMVSMASALIIDFVEMEPSEVEPGEVSKISIELENNGDEDIEDVSVSLSFREIIRDTFGNVVSIDDIPFVPYESSSEVSFDEIKSDKSKTAEFEIQALSNAQSGVYKIPVEISYFELGVEKTKESLISLSVNSDPILGVEIEDGLLLKGNKEEVSIKIINKGLSDVRFLEVSVGISVYYDVLSAENIYIGDIDSDDFDVVDFKVYFKGNAPNAVTLPVSVSYKDSLNNEYTESFDIELNVYTTERAIELGLMTKNNTQLYVGVVVGLIVLYIIYKKIKKRLKKKAS